MNSTSYAALTAESRLGVVFDGPLMITAAVSAEPYVGYPSPDGEAFLESTLPFTFAEDIVGTVEVYLPRSTFGFGVGAGMDLPNILPALFSPTEYIVAVPHLRAEIIPFNKPGKAPWGKMIIYGDYYLTGAARHLFEPDIDVSSDHKPLLSSFGAGMKFSLF
jgi:hypothetical protein